MVAMVGDYGFAAVDIGAVCERAEVGRAHFDRCFADLEDCFLSLHAEVMEQLCLQAEPVANTTKVLQQILADI